MPASPSSLVPKPVITVLGPVSHEQLGITDAHNHVWIEPVLPAGAGTPVLNQAELILQELVEYRRKGGASLLDCQPGGCGRDGSRLRDLSLQSGVNIIACTGFHRRKYYPADNWIWKASSQEICNYLCSELMLGLAETLLTGTPVKAGFIKIALEANWSDCPGAALEAAGMAARQTQALLQIHTEKGSLAEKACIYFMDRGITARQLVLCHMDKRPDASLHKALAELGVLLEYDTFYRPKYDPAGKLWPLIEEMVAAGYSAHLALATDLAESELYHSIGIWPGLASLPGQIRDQLRDKGIPEAAQKQLLGGNIARRLAGMD